MATPSPDRDSPTVTSRDEAAADVFLAMEADALLFVGMLSGQVQLYGGKGEEGGV